MATHSLTVPTSPRTALAADPAGRLRLVLTTNAATSLAAGLVAVLAAGWCVEELGLQSEGWTRVVGAGLVLFAADVALGARSRRRLATTALLTSVADLAWVAATAVVLATVDLTTAGRVVAVVMGVGVLDFALLQLWFRSRLLR
ncbi:MAG TPA: hypothetical protein VFU14_01275 [Acidimicrobiales bacterium]|nr:hypothetical protein [Acidimicrobiales bacterium]